MGASISAELVLGLRLSCGYWTCHAPDWLGTLPILDEDSPHPEDHLVDWMSFGDGEEDGPCALFCDDTDEVFVGFHLGTVDR